MSMKLLFQKYVLENVDEPCRIEACLSPTNNTGGIKMQDRKYIKRKRVTCGKCGHKFESLARNENIRCPKCKSNKTLSIR